jgi:hypothetical protein
MDVMWNWSHAMEVAMSRKKAVSGYQIAEKFRTKGMALAVP